MLNGTRPRRTWGAVALAVALVAGCSGSDDDGEAQGGSADGAATTEATDSTEAAEVTNPEGEWAVEAPEDHGMDPARLEEAREYAFQDDRHTQGVVVVRDGVIVSEWYADAADADSWTASWSVAKSFASATVGIAIEEGAIPGVDEPLTTWFPEWEGTEREGITLRDVLQMATGLAWDEAYDPANAADSEVIQMVTGHADQLAYAAGIEPEADPGTRWNYSSGDTMLLSRVISEATGMPTDEYAQQQLFEPLGMGRAEWWRDAAGNTLTYCCLDSTSRDLARFGQLYLQGGRWGDEQVVPADWVRDSLEPTAESEEAEAPYGYQWWVDPVAGEGMPEDMFAALGHDGQYIYVVPSLDLVVVRNGTYVKDPGAPVADPNLFAHYPPDSLVPGRGTTPPEDWDDAAFLTPILTSITAG